MKHILFLLSLLSLSASALETDNYLVWDRKLKDAGPAINKYFNHEIRNVLAASRNSSLSCGEVTKRIGEVFESHLVHDNPVEQHLLQVLDNDEIYPSTLYHVPESIYRDPFRIYIPYFGLAPNIQVNGFYFGTDKLSHFASTGRIYFDIYQKTSKIKSALEWGVRDEKTLHGYWASGVFSYADLEANFQGLLFYHALCHGNQPYLEFKNSRWFLKRDFRIQDFVSGLWDETYLESYRLPGNWKKVKGILENKYCGLRETPLVRERFRYYDEHLPRRSSQGQMKSSHLPKAQSFQDLCRSQSLFSL